MRYRLLLVLLLLLTTACDKKDETADKPDSNPESAAVETAEAAAAKEKAEAESSKAAEMAKEAEAEAEAKRLAGAADSFKTLSDEMNAGMREFMQARRKVRTQAEMEKLAKSNPMNELGPKFIEFANEYAGTDEAFEALTLMATRGTGDSKTEAVNVLIEKHVDHDKISEIVSTFSRGIPTPQNEKWVDQILEKATAAKTIGNALVAKAGIIEGVKTFKGIFKTATEEQIGSVDKEVIEYVNMKRDANETDELAALMEAFIKNHASEAKIVERELFGLKYLGIGCVAPDITGPDIDGKEFKLSDYRGKVVFLDFWGDW